MEMLFSSLVPAYPSKKRVGFRGHVGREKKKKNAFKKHIVTSIIANKLRPLLNPLEFFKN
jgi:hypothetical protein